uniref:Uncharacterized protein n=1 Tax=Sphaerodactylus townsendi TaxID=933632 RepID=A0ACB8FTX4_9SAUR
MNGPDMEDRPGAKAQKAGGRKKRGCRACCCSAGPPPPAPAAPPPASGAAPAAAALLDVSACEDQFACKELESLFQNYNLKLEQTSTLKALAVLIVLTASLALLEHLSAPSLSITKGSHPVHCIIFLSLFIVTNVKYLQVTQLQQIVKLTLLFAFTFAFLCCPFSLGAYGLEPPGAPEQGMWQLMLVTFVSYALLPVRTLLAVLFGFGVAVSHLIVAAASVRAKRQPLWRTVSGPPPPSVPPTRCPQMQRRKCCPVSSKCHPVLLEMCLFRLRGETPPPPQSAVHSTPNPPSLEERLLSSTVSL